MNKKGLTLTVIFKAQSLNYGEGIGNIAELKKLSRADGQVYTYASRQAIRYDIARMGKEVFNWNLEVVDKEKGTVQFKQGLTIEDSEEMDLFGYMKTKKAKEGISEVRSGPVRISHAISLEEYKSDMEFLNNKGLADRIGEFPNLANIEQHLSYYTYTVTIDLEKIGVDGEIQLDKQEKIKRVKQVLEIIKILNRNIRGREENLSPVFVIGGMYHISSPFFLGRMKLDVDHGNYCINKQMLEDALSLAIGEKKIKEDTYIGIIRNCFSNEAELQELLDNKVSDVQTFFEILEKQVEQYYQKSE